MKKNALETWIKNTQKYRDTTYPAELRSGNFEHGFDTGLREGAKWLIRYLEYKADKIAFLNNERYFGACDLLEAIKEEIDPGQGGDNFKALENED